MDNPTLKRVNVVLDGSIHNRLRHESVNRNEPMALIIETALAEHFEKEEEKHHGRK